MAKFKITAQAFKRGTRRKVGRVQTEIIDTRTNALFRGCTTARQVRGIFHAFWNEVNERSAETAKALSVRRI